jgi:Carboxypeptidase regulatory-like domain
VLVALIHAGSGERRTVLTDESGQFTIAAAGAGSFTLETKRIGVRPVLTPRFSLATGETRQFDLAVAAVAARLAAVRVTGKSYCADRLKEGAETATLWEEIRAALTATLITRERRVFPVTISRFRRAFEPKGLQVRSEERSEQSGLASNPFRSVPISTLSSHGYIVPDGDSLLYHAPDVDVLLSDMFVRDHCFRMVEGTGNKRGLVGLAFQPTSARRVPDIAGVIWLDEASRELRRLEFNYTDDPFEGLWPQFPSYIDYARLPSGAWIVQRWSIRLPLVELERPDATNPLLAGQGLRRRLVAIVEEGAEASVGHRQAGVARALAGTVFDSSAGRPLAGARVSLRGTPFGAPSDAGGRFRVQIPDSGTYLLAFDHPRLDSLGYDVPARTIRVVDTLTTVDVAVPPLAKVRSELCPGSRGGSTTAVVLGTIRTPTGAPAAWATLRYRWSRFEAAPVTESSPVPAGAPVPVLQSAPGATLVADSRGRYVICDVPAGRYRLSLQSQTGEVAESDVKVDAGQIVLRDMTLRR